MKGHSWHSGLNWQRYVQYDSFRDYHRVLRWKRAGFCHSLTTGPISLSGLWNDEFRSHTVTPIIFCLSQASHWVQSMLKGLKNCTLLLDEGVSYFKNYYSPPSSYLQIIYSLLTYETFSPFLTLHSPSTPAPCKSPILAQNKLKVHNLCIQIKFWCEGGPLGIFPSVYLLDCCCFQFANLWMPGTSCLHSCSSRPQHKMVIHAYHNHYRYCSKGTDMEGMQGTPVPTILKHSWADVGSFLIKTQSDSRLSMLWVPPVDSLFCSQIFLLFPWNAAHVCIYVLSQTASCQ